MKLNTKLLLSVSLLGLTLLLSGCTGDDGTNGARALIKSSAEPAGENCIDGGSRFDVGLDEDASGVLDASEVDYTEYVCNGGTGADGEDGVDGNSTTGETGATGNTGADGEDGLSVLINTTAVSQNCNNGGVRYDVGVDDNNNGILENSEIDSTDTICNGTDASWGDEELLESASGHTFNPQVAIDANGNVVVVWRQFEAGDYSIFSNRYSNGMWGVAVEIDSSTEDAANYTPQVAIDGNGTVVAVWVQSDGSVDRIYTNRYSNGSWGVTAVEIGLDIGGWSKTPQVAIDANGNVVAVWAQVDGLSYSIYANRYSNGSWGTAEVIESGSGNVLNPQVAIDDNGNVVAAWSQDDGGTNNIHTNRYSNGAWDTTSEVIDSDSGIAGGVQIAIDSNGNVVAVWHQNDGNVTSIYTNRYSNGAWGTTAEVIESGSGIASFPQVAIDSNGNVVVVWHQNDGSVNSIYTNRYSNGIWGTEEVIESASGSASLPQVAIDSNGNVVVVWHQNDGSVNSIYTNRYSNGIWGTEEVIESDSGHAFNPQVAIDANGNVVVVWRQFYGSAYSIYTNRYE